MGLCLTSYTFNSDQIVYIIGHESDTNFVNKFKLNSKHLNRQTEAKKSNWQQTLTTFHNWNKLVKFSTKTSHTWHARYA